MTSFTNCPKTEIAILVAYYVYKPVFGFSPLSVSTDTEELCEPRDILCSNGLNDTTVLLKQLKHAEDRARLAEAAFARAQDDLQKMR